MRLVRGDGQADRAGGPGSGDNEGTLSNWVNADQRRRDGGEGALSEDERVELEIGVLVPAGLFLSEDAGIQKIVTEKAKAGVRVRILLGQPAPLDSRPIGLMQRFIAAGAVVHDIPRLTL